MTVDELIKLEETNWKDVRMPILKNKGASYSGPGSDDTLANFKRGAILGRSKPEVVLVTYLLKHIDAIVSWVHSQQESEPIESRIDDAQNYLALLRGLIIEEKCAKGELKPEFIFRPVINASSS